MEQKSNSKAKVSRFIKMKAISAICMLRTPSKSRQTSPKSKRHYLPNCRNRNLKIANMQTGNLIAVNEFCVNHNIEISFITSLQQIGLIEITNIHETGFIDVDQLQHLEKIVRFYFELDINLEGIETINHLLERMQKMQNEIITLKNRLRLYEINE